jgi:hypothetical protein
MTSSQVWQYQPGLFNANSYLVSGIPFLTGGVIPSSSFSTNDAEKKITFPYVARTITVINRTNTDLKVHFASNAAGRVSGSAHHYLTLPDAKDSFTFNVKCKEIYVSLMSGSADGEFELAAELTTIPTTDMFNLTGSGITG